ncbi:lipase chaperone [Streptococcus marmotae]|uniref:lipase chaperone n=1 Tax=Streptococcus marmotae TaxID=1825069 RepID=UPI0008335245|nr:lipase chaperone [Streptococcus marmotae]
MKTTYKMSLTLLSTLLLLTACSQSQDQTSKESSTGTTSQVSSTSSSTASSSTETSSSLSTADALHGKNTGVTLESGQDTIKYATMILGEKEWQIIEDNYNRTDTMPFNLLQGNDHSLYRVYQNGVITDMDETIIHQP